jgi:aspartate racemase
MMKHIGILAHSGEGALLCYRTAVHEGISRLGPHHHPPITMTGVSMHVSMAAWEAGDHAAIRDILAADVVKLAAAGADFFVLPDNTAHIALERHGEALALPGIHIADVVAETARLKGYKRVGILGTRWTMEGDVYPHALQRKGIEYEIPNAVDREFVQRTIFEELCLGRFDDAARTAFSQIIERLRGQGCDAVALVCTEIPILITQEDAVLPILDSTRLLAKAAVSVALGDSPLPEWRGGPPG